MVLPSARNVKHGAGSVQTKQFPRKGYGCHLRFSQRSVIHSSAPPMHLTRPEHWPLPKGSVYERVAYCAMPHFLTLETNGKTLKF